MGVCRARPASIEIRFCKPLKKKNRYHTQGDMNVWFYPQAPTHVSAHTHTHTPKAKQQIKLSVFATENAAAG